MEFAAALFLCRYAPVTKPLIQGEPFAAARCNKRKVLTGVTGPYGVGMRLAVRQSGRSTSNSAKIFRRGGEAAKLPDLLNDSCPGASADNASMCQPTGDLLRFGQLSLLHGIYHKTGL